MFAESFDNLLHSYNPATRPMDRTSLSDVLESLPDGTPTSSELGSKPVHELRDHSESNRPPTKPARRIPTVGIFSFCTNNGR